MNMIITDDANPIKQIDQDRSSVECSGTVNNMLNAHKLTDYVIILHTF